MANQEIPNFLKRQGDSLLFDLPDSEFIFYVPEDFFGNEKIAVIVGTQVSMIGICNYTIIDKNGKNNGLHPFTFPTIFLCTPYKIEKLKGVKLTSDSEKSDYRLLRFRQGDMVVNSIKVPQIIDNVETFFKMFFITSKIPTTIPYDQLQNYFPENIKLNGSSYGINMQQFGMAISEVARDKKDMSKPFRLSGSTDMHDYKPVSIKTIPNYISPFVSITSENFDESLMGAVLSKESKYSPLEKVLTQ